jgi:hypothetical protein
MDPRAVVEGAVAGLGIAIAIGVMEWLSQASHYPLTVIPFATSIALVIGSPDAEPAQPRALIGGHVVATLVGLAMLKLTGRRCGGWVGDPCDVSDRHVSPSGRDRPAAGGLQQPALVVPVGPGAGRRAAADGVRLSLASLTAPPPVAAALAVMAYQDVPDVAISPRFLRVDRSPSRTSTTLRPWKAVNVDRCPIDTMVVSDNFSSKSR